MSGVSLDRLCVHTATTRPLPLELAVDEYARAGVSGITVWRDAYAESSPAQAAKWIAAAGLTTVSLCRGGFFVSPDEAKRQSAIDENRTAVREASELGAPLVVLVCGADPAVPLSEARSQIQSGIEAVLPLCEELGVRLAIEPLHPMYADSRSAITSMSQANDLCDRVDSPHLGIAVDVYHLWFDQQLEAEIARAGDRVFAFHVCDWRTPTEDLLLDRGLMGEGCIDIPGIRRWVESAGFDGYCEVEIFSNRYWALDQRTYLSRIVDAFQKHV
jgi:sugar phosphate isomerase/epimerase